MEVLVSRKRRLSMSTASVEAGTLPPVSSTFSNASFCSSTKFSGTAVTTQPPSMDPPTLAQMIADLKDKPPTNWEDCRVLVVDCRRFLDYNTSHIRSAVNICCSKLVRRRLQENKMSVVDVLLQQLSACGLYGKPRVESLNLVLYDHQPFDLLAKERVGAKCSRKTSWAGCPTERTETESAPFVHFLLHKLTTSAQLASVAFLKGGFMEFQSQYPELCEGAAPGGGVAATPGRGASARLSLSSLSQPCLPTSNPGPTRILPFLYLGSQADALDSELLARHGISSVLNLSNSCPRPDFLPDSAFLRIPVNDSYSEKLLPHFTQAFTFLDEVRASNGSVLVHCLAGISRSPSLAIAYIMRHLHMTSEEAYRYVKEKRPSISPNFNFLGQLLEYQKLLERERGMSAALQLQASHRRVLVRQVHRPGVPGTARLSSCSHPPTPSLQLRRSFSCPHNVSREDEGPTALPTALPAGLQLHSLAPEQSHSSVQTPSPVRSAAPNTEPSIAGPARPCGFPARPFALDGLGPRRDFRIPSIVQEDLPSPSTELSKLSFGMDTAVPAPATTKSTSILVMEDEPFHTPPEEEAAPKASPESAFEEVSVTPGSGTCAANPFFSVMKVCTSETSSTLAGTAAKPSPPVTQQPPSASSSTSAENPFFGPPGSSPSIRTYGASKRPHDQPSGARPECHKKPTLDKPTSFSTRLTKFFSKASWGPNVPLFGRGPLGGHKPGTGGFLAGYFTDGTPMSRSRTAHSLSTTTTPKESGFFPPRRVDTVSEGLGTAAESPESGFAESSVEVVSPATVVRDPDLDSISSASSLEIPVN